MQSIRFFLVSFISVSALLSSFALGSQPNDKARIAEALKYTVVQQKLEDCDFSSKTARVFEGIQVNTVPGGDVVLSGKDRSGKAWRASYEATPGAGCQIWKVDLGRNGALDLAFLSFGANSSGGWDTTLSLLLFDRNGLPFPWQATSKFETTPLGIRELVKLGNARTPAVIVASPQQSVSGEQKAFDDHIFTFAGDGTSEVFGKQESTTWPSNTPASEAVGASSTTSLSTYEATPNSSSESKAAVFVSLKGTTDSERRLEFSNGEIAVPKLLVVDRNNVREITSFPDKAELLKLKPGATTKATLGQDCNGDQCAPVVLWISQ